MPVQLMELLKLISCEYSMQALACALDRAYEGSEHNRVVDLLSTSEFEIFCLGANWFVPPTLHLSSFLFVSLLSRRINHQNERLQKFEDQVQFKGPWVGLRAPRVGNHARLLRPVHAVSGLILNVLHNLEALQHFPKHHMLAVQPRGLRTRNRKSNDFTCKQLEAPGLRTQNRK